MFFQSLGKWCCASNKELEEAGIAEILPVLPAASSQILRQVVTTSTVCQHISKDRVDDVVAAFKGPVRSSAGEVVIRQGDSVASDQPGLYVLMKGSADCYIAKGDEAPPGRHVFTFKTQGQAFGEIALLYNCPRTATIVTRSDAEFYHLDRDSFRIGMDTTNLARLVERHAATVSRHGIVPQSLSNEHGIFNINMAIECVEPGQNPFEAKHNLFCYYKMCKASTSVIATLSCFSVWAQHGKANGHAKVIPAVHSSRLDGVRVFFFDDNLEWAGKHDSPGICNLRNVDDGKFVDFSVGANGFSRDHVGKYTIVHHSSEFANVLVQANILDAMEDPDYFTNITRKYALPGEKIIAYVDVNSTIMSVDSVSAKDMTSVILGTMLEFITIEPKDTFEVAWDARPPVVVEKKMTFKQLAKKISNDDTEYYHSFYTPENCKRLITTVIPKSNISWSQHDRPFSVDSFQEAYEHYQVALAGCTNDIGLVQSWSQLYRNLTADGHSVVLNSFGMDVRKTVVKTVPDERCVLHVAVSFEKWNPKDKQGFEKTYELSKFGRSLSEKGDKGDK